jgi:hypothetical protein
MRSLAVFVFGIMMLVATQCGDPGVRLQNGEVEEVFNSRRYNSRRYIDEEAGVVCYTISQAISCLPIKDTNLDIGE